MGATMGDRIVPDPLYHQLDCLSSNVKELKAVQKALVAFSPTLIGKRIQYNYHELGSQDCLKLGTTDHWRLPSMLDLIHQ